MLPLHGHKIGYTSLLYLFFFPSMSLHQPTCWRLTLPESGGFYNWVSNWNKFHKCLFLVPSICQHAASEACNMAVLQVFSLCLSVCVSFPLSVSPLLFCSWPWRGQNTIANSPQHNWDHDWRLIDFAEGLEQQKWDSEVL